MTESVPRRIHMLAPCAAEGHCQIEDESFVFATDPARYRTVRTVCVLVGSAFLLIGALAAWQGLEYLLGAGAGIAIGACLLYLGLSPPPALRLRVDPRQIVLVRKHTFGIDESVHPVGDVQKLLIWSMQFGQRLRAHTQWGLGAKLPSGEIIGLFKGNEQQVREMADALRTICQLGKNDELPLEEGVSAQGW